MKYNLTFDEIADDELIDFLKQKSADYENFEDLTEPIKKTEVKHSTKNGKMPRSTQKLYVFVYSRLIAFPESNIDNETVTTTKYFQNVDQIIKVKVHLHLSHVTGEILE